MSTVAEALLREEEVFDDEQHFILEEVVRYLDSETNEGGFQQMGSEWPHLVLKIFSMGEVSSEDIDVLRSVRYWHQQQAAVSIWLGRELKQQVKIQLNRNHRENQRARLLEDAEEFAASKRLWASFECSGLPAPLEVVADALRRNVTCRCTVEAPLDKRRYQSRLNWLLSQLPEVKAADTVIHIDWDGGQRTSVPLNKLRKDENEGRVEGALPLSFELSRSFDLANRFAGPRTFVEGVDAAVWSFYDTIARHIHVWEPARSIEADADDRSNGHEKDRPRTIVGKGEVPGGIVTLFDDNSIELETANGTQFFQSLAELESSFKNSKPPAGPSQPAPKSGAQSS